MLKEVTEVATNNTKFIKKKSDVRKGPCVESNRRTIPFVFIYRIFGTYRLYRDMTGIVYKNMNTI